MLARPSWAPQSCLRASSARGPGWAAPICDLRSTLSCPCWGVCSGQTPAAAPLLGSGWATDNRPSVHPPSPTRHALFQHLGRSFWSGPWCGQVGAHGLWLTQPQRSSPGLAGCGVCLGAVTQPCRCCLLCELYWGTQTCQSLPSKEGQSAAWRLHGEEPAWSCPAPAPMAGLQGCVWAAQAGSGD